MSARVGERQIPFLTFRAVGRGRILVMNVRTFSEDDFGKAGEYLLAPKALGLSKDSAVGGRPDPNRMLRPLRVDFRGPAGVGLSLFKKQACFYNSARSPHGSSTRARWLSWRRTSACGAIQGGKTVPRVIAE